MALLVLEVRKSELALLASATRISLFSKHALVGVIGLVIHLIMFNLLALFFSFNFYLAQALGISVAIVLTFVLHKRWTYKERLSVHQATRWAFGRYWLIQSLAIPIPLGTMFIGDHLFGLDGLLAANLFGNLIGPLLAAVVRFQLSDTWVFSLHGPDERT